MRSISLLLLLSCLHVAVVAAEASVSIERLVTAATSLNVSAQERRAAAHAIRAVGSSSARLIRKRIETARARERVDLLGLLADVGDADDLPQLLQGVGKASPFDLPALRVSLRRFFVRMSLPLPAEGGEEARAAWLSAEAERLRRIRSGGEGGAVLGAEKRVGALAACRGRNWVLRYAACEALREAGPGEKGVTEALLDRVRSDPVAAVQAVALEAIGQRRGLATDQLRLLSHPSWKPEVVVEWAGGLAQRGEADGLKALHRLLTHEQYRVRLRAAELVERRASPFSEGPLAALLTRPAASSAGRSQWVGRVYGDRVVAARALGALQGQGISGCLQQALNDQDPGVRVAAALALKRQGGVGLLWRFTAGVGDEQEEVRAHAVRALGLLGGAGARQVLMKACEDPSSRVRSLALVGVLLVGNDRDRIETQLKRAESDAQLSVSLVAAECLATLRGNPFFSRQAPDPSDWRARLEADSLWPRP
ncbi:MAG: HEAT repeat domain-containing protein [Planctomycetota bacterium]